MFFKEYLQEDTDTWMNNSTIKTPVYHGTNKKFTQFELQKSKRYVLFSEFDVEAQGFFFSESKQDAAYYGSNILTCYVNLRKPLLDPRIDTHLGVNKLPEKKEAFLAFILRNALKDKYLEVGVGAKYVSNVKRDVEMRNRNKNPKALKSHINNYSWIYYAIGSGGLAWDMLDMPKVVSAMKKLGFDGTFVDEDHHSELGRSIFVLSPDQIKIVNMEKI